MLDGMEQLARTTSLIARGRIVGTVCAWTESTRTRARALPDGMVQIARTTLMIALGKNALEMGRAMTV
jgi:hypothetical protein